MPLDATIIRPPRPLRKAGFANAARNFVDRTAVRLPGFPRTVIGAVAAMAVMTIAGAFGTGAMPLGMRAGFWAVLMGWSLVKWQAWFALMVRKPADWLRASVLGAILLNLPLPLEIGATLALFGIGAPTAAVTIWTEALAISAVLGVAVAVLRRSRAAVPALAAVAPALRPDGVLARAGLPSADALAAIEAEDHYCRVHRAGGASGLVHARFADALEEVAGLEGLRVHRGAWVADAAVVAAARDGRRWQLMLADGRRIAVSARYVAAVRARGWLHRRAG